MLNIKRLFRHVSRTLLGNPSSRISTYAGRRDWYDAELRKLASAGDYTSFEQHLLQFSRQQSPSTWAITHYVTKVVSSGIATLTDEVLAAPKLRDDLRSLLEIAVLRRQGDEAGALRAVRFDIESPVVRKKMAEAQRSVYHQMRDHLGKAEATVKFIQFEPELFLAEFGFNAAGSAENANRPDLYAVAMSRAIRDVTRAKVSGKLQRENWREAARVALKLFDIEGALSILRMQARRGSKLAQRDLEAAKAVKADMAPFRDVLNAARLDLAEKASGGSGAGASGKPVLVMHSAAFSSNAIDYVGFRQDIRFFLSSVAEALSNVPGGMAVGTKASTHGQYRSVGPYFSYHTIAAQVGGLHFKETDRPSSFSLDPLGYSGWSEFSQRTQLLDATLSPKADAFFADEQKRVFAQGISKYAQPVRAGAILDRPFVFVGLQVQGDSVQELAFMDTSSMLDEVCKACEATGHAVVVKRHPQCKSASIAKLVESGAAAGRFIESAANIHDLIEQSVAVCVANSAVGAEALLHEKPVYVFGRSEYMQAAYVCEHAGDFGRLFAGTVPLLTPTQLRIFWYILRNQYAVDLRDRDVAKQTISDRVHTHLTAFSPSQFEKV